MTKLRVAIVTPLSVELCQLLVEREPRIELLVDQTLLPPMRWPGDHEGDPSFTRTPEQQAAFEALVDSADALYGIPDTNPAQLARTVRANPNLQWVHTMAAGGGSQVKAAGLTNEELARIKWSKSAGPHAAPLAEFAIFGLLAGAKTLPRLLKQQRESHWSGRWVMQHVYNMRVAVIGLGAIGQHIAAQLHAMGAEVVGVGRRELDAPYLAEQVRVEDFASVVGSVDAIISALPGTAQTENLFNAQLFAAMKPGMIIANVGRGTVIDEAALVTALDAGQVGYAALDVFAVEPLPEDSPLWQREDVLISPHTSALDEAEDRLIAELFASNATRLLDGLELAHPIDTVAFY